MCVPVKNIVDTRSPKCESQETNLSQEIKRGLVMACPTPISTQLVDLSYNKPISQLGKFPSRLTYTLHSNWKHLDCSCLTAAGP